MTHKIDIKVKTQYIKNQSAPTQDRYVFSYTITIVNTGDVAAKLISRHWVITDGHGNVQEVRGAGVVGQQPRITPGESYEYTSGTVMECPVGSMQGSYQMITDDQVKFDAIIPSFTLSIPHALN